MMSNEQPVDWRVWWQGSGPERGDHIMAVTDSGISYKHEVAYIGDQHHDAAGKIVAAHNAAVGAYQAALLRISKAKGSGSNDARYLAGIAIDALAGSEPKRESGALFDAAREVVEAFTAKPENETATGIARHQHQALVNLAYNVKKQEENARRG